MKATSLLVLLLACSSRQPDHIRQKMLDLEPEYQRCYKESETFKKKEKRGFKLAFSINTDGTTEGHKLVDQVGFDRKMDDCFLTVMKKLQFQPHPKGQAISVSQPFNFYP